MEIATIGFTGTSARGFFERIRGSGLPLVVDVRLNNTSQLAGFAKRDVLAYFLDAICGVGFVEEKWLAPTEELLAGYRKKKLAWEEYAAAYERLLFERGVAEALDRSLFEKGAILLCSEPGPERCHRRLAAEFLGASWGGAEIRHL